MTPILTIVWLALSSILWGAILVGVGLAFQSLTRASGAERQWLWRGLAFLLMLPWLVAPFATLMPRPDFKLPEMLPELPAQNVSVTFTAPMGEASVAVPQAALPWPEIALALIVAGWAWRVFAARRSAGTLAKIVERSTPAREGLALGLVRTWAQRLSLRRRPDLRLTEPSVSPFSYGAAKPVICLPEDMERNLKPAALDLVVGHECLHVARGDGWLRPIERLIADLMWFNPFAWAMRRQLDLARELACDEAVLDRCAAPNDYARVLRDVAGLVSGLDANTPVASMSLSGGGRNLVLRVTRALRHAKRKPGHAALAGMLFIALIGAPMAIAQALIVHGPDGGAIETSPDTQRPMLALIHAPMDAVVTVSPRSAGVSQGEFVILRAVAGDELHKGCVLGVDGLTDLRVVNGARVKAGEPIGVKHPDSREIFGEPPAHTPCGMTAAQGYDWRGAPLPKGASTERLVASAYDGKVVFAGNRRDEGSVIEIAHGRDRQRYPHMSDIRVKLGQQVAAGEVIGARKPMTPAEAEEAARRYAVVRVGQPVPPMPPAQLAAPPREAQPAPAPAPSPEPAPAAPAREAVPAIPAPPALPAAPARAAAPAIPATPPALPARGAPPVSPPAPPPLPAHAEIRTPFDARVTKVASSKDLGLYVVIEQVDSPQGFGGTSAHDCRVEAPHLSKTRVKQGQSVRAGELIGERSNGDDNITVECKSLHINVDQFPSATVLTPSPRMNPEARLVGADEAILSPPAHLSSGFGFRDDPFTKKSAWHEGVDIAAPSGAVVHAPGPGKVTFVGQKAGYENVVELQLPDRMLRFAHLKTMAVKQGDEVAAGAALGTVGMDGSSTGPHLHLEMWIKGKSWDPQKAEGLVLIGAN